MCFNKDNALISSPRFVFTTVGLEMSKYSNVDVLDVMVDFYTN